MKIAIFTNTFTPHVGGVARSVQAFTDEYRRLGHRVLVVAPEFAATPDTETDVIRISAIQNFNASDFSVALPVPQGLNQVLMEFKPDVIHSQHPFLLGMTALRAARSFDLPLVFTHHTLYEQYTHYVPGDSELLRGFVIALATHYANLSDQVIAPSESIRELIISRGVDVPVEVIPTGVSLDKFATGTGAAIREQFSIPDDSFVVGHMGRLALEKNIGFLVKSVLRFLEINDDACFLVVGEGEAQELIEVAFSEAGKSDRLCLTGTLENQQLTDALKAMDLFAFASKSETQGMVLTEAMAAGLPVVGLDASGVREVVKDKVNGRLVEKEDQNLFADALDSVATLDQEDMDELVAGAHTTARKFSLERSAQSALECFNQLQRQAPTKALEEEHLWELLQGRIKAEWEIMSSLASAGEGAFKYQKEDPKKP